MNENQNPNPNMLQAIGMVANAPKAPESLNQLMETSRLLRISPDLLATQPEEMRQQYLSRALARNPGLMRFASQNLVSRSIAVANAEQGGEIQQAFANLQATDLERLPKPASEPAHVPLSVNEPESEEEEEEKEDFIDIDFENVLDDIDESIAGNLESADLYELSGGQIEQAERLAQGKGPYPAQQQSALDYVLNPFKNFANGWLDLVRGVLGAGKSVPDLVSGRDSALSRWFAESIDLIKAQEFQTRRPESFGARLAQDVVRNSPQLGAQIGTWLYGGAAASLGFIFSLIYGQDYLKHEEKRISPENAAFAAFLDASLQTAIEKAGFQALLSGGALGKLADSISKGGLLERNAVIQEISQRLGSSKITQTGSAALRGAAIEGATEAVQHAPEYLSDFWAESSLYNNSLADRYEWTKSRVLDARNLLQGTKDALYEGLVGAILGAPVAGAHSAYIQRRLAKDADPEINRLYEQEAANFQATLKRLEFEQALNKARQAASSIQDKEQSRAIIRSSLPENMQQAWLAPNDLSQILGRDPRRGQEILESSGRSIEEINEALNKDLPIQIDLASLLSSAHPEAQLIQENLRLTENGPTYGQASAYSPEKRLQEVLRILNQEDELEGFSDDEKTQAIAEEAHRLKHMSSRIEKEVKRLSREMQGSGLSELEAQANSALLRAHALAWWKRFGIDSTLLLQNLSIQKAADLAPEQQSRNFDGEEIERVERKDYEPEWIEGERPARKTVLRGQLALSKAGAIIRLFKDRDISTVAHESGHLFLQDLIKIARNGPADIINNYLDEISNMTGQDLEYAGDIGQELAELREKLGNDADALREFAGKLLQRSKNQNELAENLAQGETQGDLDPNAEADPNVQFASLRSQISRKLALQARLAAGWLEAAQDARADLEIFAQHAGLDEAQLEAASQAALDLELRDPALLKEYNRLHEYTANAFVNYLSKGNAPTSKLAQVMARFQQWLANLWSRYRDSAQGELSPQLKGAFDRLLATDRDMRIQEGLDAFAHHEQIFLKNKHMSQEEKASLKALLRRAQANNLRKGERLRRKHDEKWLKSRASQIYKDLALDPFWLLAEKGRFKFSDAAAILGEARAKSLQQAWPVLFNKKGSDLDQTAAEANFDSKEQMLEELFERLAVKHESRRAIAESRAQEELQAKREEEGDVAFLLNPDLENYLQQAEGSVARVVARLHLKNENEIARWVDNSRVPQVIIDNMAAMRLEYTPLRQLTPQNLERQLNRTLAKRDRLLESSAPADLMQALNMANEARVIYAMMAEADRAHKLLAKIRKFGRKLADAKPGTHAAKQTEALRQLLSAYGLGTIRTPQDYALNRGLPDLVREIMAEEDSTGSLPAFPDWLLEKRLPQNTSRAVNSVIQPQYLSPSELQDLYNLMKFLDKSGRGERGIEKSSIMLKVNSAAQHSVAAMDKLPDKPLYGQSPLRDFISNLSDKGFSAIDILLYQMRKADGMTNIMGKGETGPMEELWGNVIKGEERVRSWLDKVHRAMQPHLEHLEKTRRRLEKQYGKNLRLTDLRGREIVLPEAVQNVYHTKYYTAEMLFTIALHTGNNSNYIRLLKGYQDINGINESLLYNLFGDTRFANLKYIIDPQGKLPHTKGLLDASDWRAIQGIWDSLALLWPDTKRVHNSLYGFSPEVVHPQSFEVQNEDGSVFRLDGGYFPVKYDGRIHYKVGQWSAEEDLAAMTEAMYTKPNANKSHTEKRVKRAPGYPILLNMSPIGEHVRNAALFIELAPTTYLIDKITRQQDFRRAYTQKYGKEDYDAIRPNLKGLLRTEKLPDVIAYLEHKIRKFVVPWGLSWNPNVALIQSTAIFPAMGDLGIKPILNSMKQLILHPSLRKEIWKASPYMLSRMTNLDQDLIRQLEFTAGRQGKTITYKGKSYSYEDLVDLGMKGIIIVDAAATCTVWLAAYRAKLNELRSKAQNPEPGPTPAPEPGPAPASDPAPALEQSPDKSPEQSQEQKPEQDPDPSTDTGSSSELELAGKPQDKAPSEDSASISQGEGGIILNHENAENAEISENPAPDPGSADPSSAGPDPEPDNRNNNDTDNSPGPDNFNLVEFDDANHNAAVLYADTIVKQSNPDFDPSSRSSFLRSRGMMRLFNQFSSAITLFSARNHFMLTALKKGQITKARYSRHLAQDFLFPAAFLFLFFGAIRDFWDKKANPGISFTGLLLDQVSMAVPIFGGPASDLTQNLLGLGSGNYRRGDIRTSLEAPVDIAKGASASINKLTSKKLTKEEKKAATYALLDLASFLSRIPVSKIARRADRGYDQYKRGEGSPFSPILPKPGK